jgi:multiple sugar transport system substrate-binding protein
MTLQLCRGIVAACILSAACRPSELSLPQGQRKLTLWHSYNNEETRVFNELLADYQKQNPQIKIVAERVPFDGLLPKLTSAAIAHRTPDIARVDIGHIPRLAWGKAIEPLDAFGAEKLTQGMHRIARPVASVLMPGKTASEIFAIPDQLTTVALYYNKDLMAATGVAVPRTLSELKAIGKKFSARGRSSKALAINSSLWWIMPWLFLHEAQVLSPQLDKCLLSSAEAVATLEYLRGLYTDGVEAGAWLSGAINPDQGFMTGRYAMILSGPWNLQTFSKIKFGVSLVPGNGKIKSASNIGGSAMVVFAASREKQESYRLLEYLVSEPVQKKWIKGTGQLSVNTAANRAMAASLSPELRVFLEQLDYAGARPALPGYDALESIVAPYLYAALDGSLASREALERACADVEKNLLVPNR